MSQKSPDAPLPPRQQLVAAGKWPSVGERAAQSPAGAWRISLHGEVEAPRVLTLAELQDLPQVERTIDIHCVTRWSKLAARFRGVRLADLLTLVTPRPAAQFVSFVAYSARDHSTSLPVADALALETLVVWQWEGEPLPAEHGGPVRVIVPGRYFYKSLKWLREIELLSHDVLGYWEREAGYHNSGDPWREQRYLAPHLSRAQMQEALAQRDFSRQDLRSLDASGHDLAHLTAVGALLRDAKFNGTRLVGADFTEANLSNAELIDADLQGAQFVRADVEGADFTGADLRGADFTGASLLGVTFCSFSPTGQTVRPAKVDQQTRIPTAARETLLPAQAEFLRQALAG